MGLLSEGWCKGCTGDCKTCMQAGCGSYFVHSASQADTLQTMLGCGYPPQPPPLYLK